MFWASAVVVGATLKPLGLDEGVGFFVVNILVEWRKVGFVLSLEAFLGPIRALLLVSVMVAN